jgi:hypothetical protein
MEAFRQFVVKSRLQLSSTQPLQVCLGNVSVDMDSVVGSLTLAYYYSLKHTEQHQQ